MLQVLENELLEQESMRSGRGTPPRQSMQVNR